ncbi:MAG: spore coat assemly protein [Thermosediminibacterales bacterium]|nr:spore coat assemly protein [Thermosediminibacterales bacterium]
MSEIIKVGDVVSRKSYNRDVYFKIIDIVGSEGNAKAILKGLELRILADAPLDDLEKVTTQDIREYKKNYIRASNECLEKIFSRRKIYRQMRTAKSNIKLDERDFFDRPGRVLHIDGDGEYLQICMNTYKQLFIEAVGENIPEWEQPQRITRLLKQHSPDILVITGHDGLINKNKSSFTDINSYRNSKYFIESVKKARQFEPALDDLVIFAGACQSFYEGLLAAGANFASSPHRVFIHALDPVFVIEKIAYSPINETISIKDVISSSITGIKGIGGLQTRGKLREGLPRSPYE